MAGNVPCKIAVPLTFAPAGEPVLPRGTRSSRGGREDVDAQAPVFPRGNTRSDGNAFARFRLRQVFGLVDVTLGLLSVASRMHRIQCL